MTADEIGSLVRSRRRILGLTQQDLAELAGVGVRLISEIENGSTTVTLARLAAVCREVGIEVRAVEVFG